MKNILLFCLLLLSLPGLSQSIFSPQNLTAWCIVPFDKVKRGPEARIAMLERLGFKQYVYDWRKEHLSTFEQEIQQARQHNIQMEGVWMWIEGKRDKTGQLNEDNRRMLEIVAQNKLQTTFWVGFDNPFFDGLSHQERVAKGAEFLKYLHSVVAPLKCKIALYNHGGWFGEPENEIEIIQKSGLKKVGIVYSFHHGHHQINRFHSMLKNILPYVVAINLNGMDLSKGQILPIGAGKSEAEMIQMIQELGFKGRIGVLGHRDDEDVEVVLRGNLEGMRKIAK